MRRLLGGALAALILLAGCGTQGSDDHARTDPGTSDAERAPATELAAADRAVTTTPASPATLRVLVTSPEGVDAPGLDAAASVLLARPDLATTVAAPAADVTGAGDGRSSAALAAIDGATMTGVPALVVNGTAVDLLEAVLAAGGAPPDLVVIGFTGGATVGPPPDESAAFAVARTANAHGIPALVVETGGDEPDLAAAGLLLAEVLDFDMEALLAGTIHSLTVPSCDEGLVRGPVLVDASASPGPAPVPDCAQVDPKAVSDDATALAAGFATLVERR